MEKILLTERKCLKKCLCVKAGTSNDLIYVEINRADIISHIKVRQFNFFRKCCQLSSQDSIIKGIIDLYSRHTEGRASSMISYYTQLNGNEKEENISQRLNRVSSSDLSSVQRYSTIVGTAYNTILYVSDLKDDDRMMITRWRLSNHNLKIEKGRYTVPITPHEKRLCVVCMVLEDEFHALFHCKVHGSDRIRFKVILERYTSVHAILNPRSTDDACRIASYLRHIENNLNLLYDYKVPPR